jgi:hypothetical protein
VARGAALSLGRIARRIEDVLVELVGESQGCPVGSLIVVEETEVGSHPAALRRPPTRLMELAREKQLHMIVSTRSPGSLDAPPAICRMLIRWGDGQGHVIASPTTRLAAIDLEGRSKSKLFEYGEDETARAIASRISATSRFDTPAVLTPHAQAIGSWTTRSGKTTHNQD